MISPATRLIIFTTAFAASAAANPSVKAAGKFDGQVERSTCDKVWTLRRSLSGRSSGHQRDRAGRKRAQ